VKLSEASEGRPGPGMTSGDNFSVVVGAAITRPKENDASKRTERYLGIIVI
jgi:hypothetical protein